MAKLLAASFAPGVYQALTAAGTDLVLADAEYRAIESLRLEKDYHQAGAL